MATVKIEVNEGAFLNNGAFKIVSYEMCIWDTSPADTFSHPSKINSNKGKIFFPLTKHTFSNVADILSFTPFLMFLPHMYKII